VEGSDIYAKKTESKFKGKIKMFVSLFDDFNPDTKYEAVVFAGVLHHLDNPVKTLKHISNWLVAGGEIFISVPNMTAFHRQLGVKMQLSQSVYDTSDRNIFFAQPGRFDISRLTQVVRDAGFEIIESKGFFFKPFPHEIMNKLKLDTSILDGLFRMGQEYPELACQLFVKAKWNPQIQ
jgi:2-polyprenyl-3-methyl-5-hydroxy-6-metoxy-1,4-benzoquinol methylase